RCNCIRALLWPTSSQTHSLRKGPDDSQPFTTCVGTSANKGGLPSPLEPPCLGWLRRHTKPLTYKPFRTVNGPEGRARQFARSPCSLHSAEPFQAGGSKGGRQSPFSSERSERLLRSAGQRGPG